MRSCEILGDVGDLRVFHDISLPLDFSQILGRLAHNGLLVDRLTSDRISGHHGSIFWNFESHARGGTW